MTDVTQIFSAIEQGDPSAAEQLLPPVYDELRKLVAQRMGQANRIPSKVNSGRFRLAHRDPTTRFEHAVDSCERRRALGRRPHGRPA